MVPISYDPVIVLGPARSFTTVIASMLGQHPQLYGFPETHLLAVPDMAFWWQSFGRGVLSHGLLRLVAEVVLGIQNETTIALARSWILRRITLRSALVFREVARYVAPLITVDKSPLIANDFEALQNLLAAFPSAHYLHLTRHPLGQGQSLLRLLEEVCDTLGPLAPIAVPQLSQRPTSVFAGMLDHTPQGLVLDPQLQWFKVHSTILAFLSHVPLERQMRVRGEDVLSDPDRHLPAIAAWLGIRSDPAAILSMKHPEHSPFSGLGPPNARFGGDPRFLHDPALHPTRRLLSRTNADGLAGPLPWRSDGAGFREDVHDLAAYFGYS